ncbi:MAG: hypothetical protein JWN31_1260 [Frankiales bacterium]|nr:hypothetical protein [Frankiales bacterium]
MLPGKPLWSRWCAGLAVVCLGWLATPSAVPLYDGVQTPDEPYKYAGRSPAPVAATVTVPSGKGISLRSPESGPQVLLDLSEDALVSTTGTVTITAAPFVPDGQPPRGTFDGNGYRVMAAAPARLLPDQAQGYLWLRAAVMTKPDPVIVHRATARDPWIEVKTSRVGRDNLTTPFRALGDYAMIQLPGAKPIESLSASTGRWLQVAGVVAAALVLGVLVIRGRRDSADED